MVGFIWYSNHSRTHCTISYTMDIRSLHLNISKAICIRFVWIFLFSWKLFISITRTGTKRKINRRYLNVCRLKPLSCQVQIFLLSIWLLLGRWLTSQRIAWRRTILRWKLILRIWNQGSTMLLRWDLNKFAISQMFGCLAAFCSSCCQMAKNLMNLQSYILSK